MTYPYENLNPESFQKFCQSLIVNEYPNTQCFPVGQPDGGRDALSYFQYSKDSDTITFQIKFKRKLSENEDVFKWLTNTVRKELPKINKLIDNGLSQYILVTNVSGTGHAATGTIDKVNAFLKENISIPSICWWRDDLDRRLDNNWNVKWAYPELLTGPDLLRSIIEHGLPAENRDRRTNAIMAFVRDQYSTDENIKFKQVDLRNNLLDLFVDIPIHFTKSNRSYIRRIHQIMNEVYFQKYSKDDTNPFDERHYYNSSQRRDRIFYSEDSTQIGAATLFLHPLTMSNINKIVLEGAPGQGKSTIAQYICQIHRLRILNKTRELNKIPYIHSSGPLMLPIKIELRDFSMWLAGQNPFSSERDLQIDSQEAKTLESFISRMVSNYSGGTVFEVSDLHSICKVSNILIVLDGLDEVAEMDKRKTVVDESIRGLSRLEEISQNMLAIVTSRPAVLSDSPAFPSKDFTYFKLGSMTRPLINDYVDKWLICGAIEDKEGEEIKLILDNKLNQPHLRELARNPMQLAILLSLIHTLGHSLPNKRTALYDSYMTHFFNREAEKSAIILKYRDLIIDIHRYLAWKLHTAIEIGENNGSITEKDLEILLSEYLDNEGYEDPTLVKTLFTGMVERVVALVSRVQGTYEFEVQPLREYFAARYLYESVPYAPVGIEITGTLPDRFEALARNFYWNNVTRFFAGCYNKGQIASLVDSLIDLINEPDYNIINQPRILGHNLLSDYVFSQSPKYIRKITSVVFDEVGLKRYVSLKRFSYHENFESLSLPEGCGKQYLVDSCFNLLEKNPPTDFILELTDIILINLDQETIFKRWNKILLNKNSKSEQKRWLDIGSRLGVLRHNSIKSFNNIFKNFIDDKEFIIALYYSNRIDVLKTKKKSYNYLIDSILENELIHPKYQMNSLLDLLLHRLQDTKYFLAFRFNNNIPLGKLTDEYMHFEKSNFTLASIDHSILSNEDKTIFSYLKSIENLDQVIAKHWARNLDPWTVLIENGRSKLGDKWIFFHLSNIAAGISSKSITCSNSQNLFDQEEPLCKRSRYARLRAGNIKWWSIQLNLISNSHEKKQALLLLLTWGSASTITHFVNQINDMLKSLSKRDWISLYKSVEQAVKFRQQIKSDRRIILQTNLFPDSLQERTVSIIGLRAKHQSRKDLMIRYLLKYSQKDNYVLKFLYKVSLDCLIKEKDNQDMYLNIISKCYLSSKRSYHSGYQGHRSLKRYLSESTARKIGQNPILYPCSLVAPAHSKSEEKVSKKYKPVGNIAKMEKWFTD